MTVKLTARFENRDMSELAVSRLRSAGVVFGISQQPRSASLPGEGQVITGASAQNSVSYMSSAEFFSPMAGARAISGHISYGQTGAVLTLRVNPADLGKAKEILRSSHGTDIAVVPR